ncbi:DegT/DnrJ/EryC1/StrS family aminotransferase [Halobacillus litoralis]|uniref:DegT/DnrJ/EryC1/StrS family aminotransferase n=1 Tax=Halobacillus litoralis TaxID=45668 RepID=UPI001CFF44B3|nr:aminotransferase class I/II-fold pyridoxal phosphate-dependent enzyme [Halobacillus litoralis]
MTGNEQEYINKAFSSNWIAPLGPNVDQFEANLADYVKVNNALAVSSGTAAIHLALRLLNVKKGDVIFCSTLTFVASANPILYEGATPVFIDAEFETWNMCPVSLEKALQNAAKDGPLPKAVIVVNLYGQTAKMDEIIRVCHEFGVPIIEDAAESLGAEYRGKKSGSFGDFGIFSFNGNKIITTSGGGMLVTNNKEDIEQARFLSTQARDKAAHYQHSEMGFNYKLSNILAGIGIAQLQAIEERVEKKREIFFRYEEELGSLDGITFMKEYRDSRHNRWLTTLMIDQAKTSTTPLKLIEALEKENIEARRVWKPLHLQPLFNEAPIFQVHEGSSVAERLFENGLCLPSGTNMTKEEQYHVINTIKKVILKQKECSTNPLVV